jgi:hypothetical protein
MVSRTSRQLTLLAFAAGLAAWAAVPSAQGKASAGQAAASLPERLSNEEFWNLSQDFSEPNGSFRSDNLVSNELGFQWVIPALVERVPSGGVYLGVGPEQNFTYIAALKPKMVFITDVRRGNLHMHLMYKALFELSKTRAEFVEMLFNKKRPANLGEKSTAAELMNGIWDVFTSPEAEYKANLKAVQNHLTKTRGLRLSQDDLDGIEYVYWSFYWFGPAITYNSSSNSNNGRNTMATYGDLMIATDGTKERSYLATEALFRVLKDLHERNLIVPVVGNFAGPKALRAVGQYVRDRGATIDAMYLSNVEQYLRQDGIWGLFCGNVASMPLTERSTFIRSMQQGGGGGSGLANYLGSMLNETRGCGRP